MRLLFLALAVPLAIAQTSPPIPRKAADASTSAAKRPKNKNASAVNPATSTPDQTAVGKGIANSNGKSESNRDKQKNNPDTVAVSKFPTVSVERDWIDYTLVPLNFCLVIIGALGVMAALATLRKIKEQANWMETQAGLMARQVEMTEPRLHVDGVRVEDFEEGRMPVFYVIVMNSGIIAAERVAIRIKAEVGGVATEYPEYREISIPANGSREFFIPGATALHSDHMAAFNSGKWMLRISGQVQWSNQTTDYCYKYYPWPLEQRPPGVPLFLPCDFENGLNIAVRAAAANLRMSGQLSAVKIEAPESAEESNNPPRGDNGPTRDE